MTCAATAPCPRYSFAWMTTTPSRSPSCSACARRLRALPPLLGEHRYIGIDFNQGHIARISPKGIHAKPAIETLWTPGLGMAVAPGASRGIMNFSHAKLGRVMPVLTLPGEDIFLRGHNAFNDSRQKDGIRPVRLPLLDAAGENAFRRIYSIDADHVRAHFAKGA